MRVRWPLSARILVWLLLNVALLVGVFWLLLRAEFRLESLMALTAGERVQRVADAVLAQLRGYPRQGWDEVLQRFGEAYGVSFLVTDERGERLAGAKVELPVEVRERLGPPWAGERGAGGPRHELGPPAGLRGRGGGGLLAPPRMFLHTRNPDRYWCAVRLPLPPGPEERGGPGTRLVIMSPTLGAGGLFVDWMPWLVGGGAVLLLSILWWLPFLRNLTGTIVRLTRATESVSEGCFTVQVDERRGDELGQLGASVNRLARRLEGYVGGQRRFLGDIAHELCAPLARIQMAVGVLEQRTEPDQRACLEDLREEVEHMSSLVNELLSFSRASLAGPPRVRARVEVRPVVERAVRREVPEVEVESVRREIPEGLEVMADAGLLERALANLVRNALRHARAGGLPSVVARQTGSEVEISVVDQGPGVAEAELERIFEPFYRLDASRARETGGVGLGLTMVRTCVEACGGTVLARNRRPSGLEIQLRLPAAGA